MPHIDEHAHTPNSAVLAEEEALPKSTRVIPEGQEFVEPTASNGPIFINLGTSTDMIIQVNQDAGILTPPTEMKFDKDFFEDELKLQEKAKELVRFVNKASEKYKFDRRDVIWIGYDKGANLISGIMLFYPTVIEKAVLLRPDNVVAPKPLPVFADVYVLMSVGRQDDQVPLDNTEKLIRTFQHSGAIVQLSQHDAEHEITDADVVAVQKWMLRLS